MKLAKDGYYTYLKNPEQHTNKASSHVGWGRTRKESQDAAQYWANQVHWTVTVPASKAPRWVVEAWSNLERHRDPA